MRSLCPDGEFDDGYDEVWAIPPDVTVHVADPEVVGTILGPDGEPLHTVLAERMPFGFGR